MVRQSSRETSIPLLHCYRAILSGNWQKFRNLLDEALPYDVDPPVKHQGWVNGRLRTLESRVRLWEGQGHFGGVDSSVCYRGYSGFRCDIPLSQYIAYYWCPPARELVP